LHPCWHYVRAALLAVAILCGRVTSGLAVTGAYNKTTDSLHLRDSIDPNAGQNGPADFNIQLNGVLMMKKATKIVLALGAALSLGLAAAMVNAQTDAQGWGGHMGGYGPGAGMMGGSGMGPGMMGGSGQAWGGHMGGYGMGAGMMGGYGQGWGGHMGGYGAGFGMMGAYTANSVEEVLAGLKVALGITTQQDSVWQAFTNNAKQQSEKRQAWFAKMHDTPRATSAPERLAQQSEFMKQRQTDMQANAAALKDLYAALTPEQRVIADQRFGGFAQARPALRRAPGATTR